MSAMNCQRTRELTAWPCTSVRGTLGEEVMVLTPPVSFWDGSIIPVYVFDRDPYFELTDDAGVLQHLEVSGFRISDDKRKQIGLRKAIERCGVTLNTEMSVFCKKEEIGFALKKYLAALFAVSHWQQDNGNKSLDQSFLISEAELYLTALNPGAKISHDAKIPGISGKEQSFPLQLDLVLYDSVTTNAAASASMVKKLFDIRSVRQNSDLDITVILDDRGDAAKTKEDTQVFSQLAHVLKFSDLQRRGLAAIAR